MKKWTCKHCIDEQRTKVTFYDNGSTVERHLQTQHGISEGKRRKLSEDESPVTKQDLHTMGVMMNSHCLLPFQFHENSMFRQYCSLISKYERQTGQPYEHMCRQSVSKRTMALGNQINVSIKHHLKDLDDLNITLDCWTSKTLEHYLGLTVHYINEEWKLKTFTLRPYPVKLKYTVLDEAERDVYVELSNALNLNEPIEVVNDAICLELAQSRIELLRIEKTTTSLLEQLPNMLKEYNLYQINDANCSKGEIAEHGNSLLLAILIYEVVYLFSDCIKLGCRKTVNNIRKSKRMGFEMISVNNFVGTLLEIDSRDGRQSDGSQHHLRVAP